MGGIGEWRVHGFIFFLQVPAFQNITLRQTVLLINRRGPKSQQQIIFAFLNMKKM